ncbi:NAD(P)/FAD-dependent oxidoreductase [Halorubrum sp. Atlit-8R]|uniref:NAD(P)/FAD-dependent oxidoreductase n=1 Tax=unclassified Halorubrum TaxID=2642239 RepID=UPI000EF19928|nr:MULTISPECIES: NAD(P)/FAD-dependent oxidoreductase [unclassified Halorubrum]RLM66898.1 NAD(P)/FAD-dependent oxidoreductase [Halorubrum sp. Atlit-9R]RLM81721.1 NAD(P)/FAD-dependent oxidoreductase [Halorubrum sp. Atlit-8R]
MERVDVAIVGGGPAGSSAAHAAATGGADALVIEKGVPRADRDRLGPDSTDAAGILDYWVDIMGIHPDEFDDGVVQRELNRAEFRGPDEAATLTSTGIDSSYDKFGYTFQRARFDDWLRNRAEDAGAEYRVGTSVRGVDTDLAVAPGDDGPRHVLDLADGGSVGADFVVLADGPQRTVTNRVLDEYLPADAQASERLASRTANHIAYQEYRRVPEAVFEEVNDAIVFWWGVMPGETAYPWIFPNADRVCRIGLTMPIGLDIDEVDASEYALLREDDESIPQGGEYIRRLLEWQYGDEYDVEEDFPLVEEAGKRNGTETYPISSTRPIDSPVDAGIAVAGGAMGTTSAFHEGGDHVAVRTGAIAGELAAEGDLAAYNRRWKEAIGDEVVRNVTMADMVADYGPDDWNRVIGAADAMLAAEAGGNLLSQPYRSGWESLKLLLGYKWNKRRVKGDYVGIDESEYVY